MSNIGNVNYSDKKPKVSIVVPVYKVEFYLARCLNSIVKQSLEDIEIIIVDEGLQDQDRIIIDEFMSHDDRIVTIHKGGGYGVSVNAGIDAARGEYIGIVESDDFIEPDMYEKLYIHAKELDADIVKSPFRQYYSDDNDPLAPMMDELLNQLPTDRFFSLRQYPVLLATHPSIWAGIYKAEWLRNTGIKFYDKGAYLDIVFRFKTLMTAEKIGWIKNPTYHWRFTNPTSTNSKWNLNASIDRWEDILGILSEDEELFREYEPYILPEAFLNIFIHYDIFKNTENQKKRIKHIRDCFSTEGIKKCIYLSFMQKHDYLLGNLDVLCCKRYLDGCLQKINNTETLNNMVGVLASLFGILILSSYLDIVLPDTLTNAVITIAVVVIIVYLTLQITRFGLYVVKKIYRSIRYR